MLAWSTFTATPAPRMEMFLATQAAPMPSSPSGSISLYFLPITSLCVSIGGDRSMVATGAARPGSSLVGVVTLVHVIVGESSAELGQGDALSRGRDGEGPGVVVVAVVVLDATPTHGHHHVVLQPLEEAVVRELLAAVEEFGRNSSKGCTALV